MFNQWFKKLAGKPDSKDVAKKRLQFALIYDKLEVSENILQDLQHDLIEVISRYFDFDQKALKLEIERHNDFSALVFNAPILSAKRARPAPPRAARPGA
jgi:cell division topological specificity factor